MFHISDLDVVFPLNYERIRNVGGRRSEPLQQRPVANPMNSVDVVNDHQRHSTLQTHNDPDVSEPSRRVPVQHESVVQPTNSVDKVNGQQQHSTSEASIDPDVSGQNHNQ